VEIEMRSFRATWPVVKYWDIPSHPPFKV
jgi:hypothetical protein